MSRFQVVALTLAVTLTLALADPVKKERRNEADMKVAVQQLVSDIRRTAVGAKNGMYLDTLRKQVLDVQAAASDLIAELPREVSECDVQSTIKMASTGIGSHEVLTVLLADDALAVLNGRLSLSLAFLEEVAQLIEDELPLSSDVGSHLTAVVFGTNTTLDIAHTADETVKSMASQTVDDHHDEDNNERVRRQVRTHFNLGKGWSVGLRGVQWDSRNGRYTFNARPTFAGIRPDGLRASFTIRF